PYTSVTMLHLPMFGIDYDSHSNLFSFFLMIPPPPISTLFPYTTLFRSPYTELATDLTNNSVPNYVFITPNLCNDMHDSCSPTNEDRKSTRLNSSHSQISYAVFCLKKKNHT